MEEVNCKVLLGPFGYCKILKDGNRQIYIPNQSQIQDSHGVHQLLHTADRASETQKSGFPTFCHGNMYAAHPGGGGHLATVPPRSTSANAMQNCQTEYTLFVLHKFLK